MTTVAIDEGAVREFVTTISTLAVKLAEMSGKPGFLQLSRLNCVDDKMVPSRFRIDDPEAIIKAATVDAGAGFNVYIEARTVRADLRGPTRGTLADTEFVFALVIDADNDKGKGGVVSICPSLVVETSSGNFHYWLFFNRPVSAKQGKEIGDAIRAASGADGDTGVVTQPYRVAGTPNFPSKAKQARGRLSVEPTRIVEHSGRLWDPDELKAAFAAQAPTPNVSGANAPHHNATAAPSLTAATSDETSLPDELLQDVRDGGICLGAGAKGDQSRSGLFHRVIAELKKRHWTVDQIHALLEHYPQGVAAKYPKRLRAEIERSFMKVENGNSASLGVPGAPAAPGGGGTSSPPPPLPGASPPPPSSSGASPGAHVLPTIRLAAGQLPRNVREAEQAVLASGAPVFARAGTLVRPVSETVDAAGGGKTKVTYLKPFTPDSFVVTLAESAIFQRYDGRRRAWVDIDPPLSLVRAVLSNDGKWAFPRVSGVIMTPTLRPDGSLIDTPGYDAATELYLSGALQLPPIPLHPTRDEALGALATLKDLFGEFPFKTTLDCSVAVAALLSALLRGSMPTAPIVLVTANESSTGKSFLVNTIAAVVTGRRCPASLPGRTREETEKVVGSIVLSGAQIMLLDNLTNDISDETLCIASEQAVVRVRILGRSETPDCECRMAMFATGNNVGFQSDMVRRGLVCELETDVERPERRAFKQNPLKRIGANRGKYVAAALTIVLAHVAAGAPQTLTPLASYEEWSARVRDPLVWLGEPDPVDSQEKSRTDDQERSNIRELFALWPAYMLVGAPYTTARIVDIAEGQGASGLVPDDLKTLLLRVAEARRKPGAISHDRLGWWLRKISGRRAGKLYLERGRDRANVATFTLRED
jgi:putative DNA primase/helicase